MAHKQLNFVILMCLISRALSSLSCVPCDKSACNPRPSDCIAGITTDACGCCDICARNVNEVCGGPTWSSSVVTCGDGLACRHEYPFGDLHSFNIEGICVEGVCEDTWSRHTRHTHNCLDSSQIPFDRTVFTEICSCSDIKRKGHCDILLYREHICIKTCGHHCGIKRSWTPETNACIRDNNNLILDHVLSLEDCKSRCQAQFEFECRSIEYNAQGRRCVLSEGNSKSWQYMEKCYLDGWTFAELF